MCPDEMDAVQDAVQAERDAAVAAITSRPPGTDRCEECGEPVGEYRMALGARLCLVHQREAEQRRHHVPKGGRR